MQVLSLEEAEEVSGGISAAGVAALLMTPVSAPVAIGIIAFTVGAAVVGGIYYYKK